jgi:hypothetical protein
LRCIRLILLFQIIGNRFQLAPEDRKIMADNFPNHLLIDTEIFMYTMIRKPTICRQGTSGYFSRNSEERFLHASPMT